MPQAPVTGGLVSFIVGCLSVADKLLNGVVDLNAAQPLTTLGSGNAKALAEIAIRVVQIAVNLVQAVVTGVQQV
jgi:cytosine/uracil/thiamine/allantoin permease